MTQKMQNFLINFQKNIKYFFPSIDCIMKSLPHPGILCFLHFRLPAISSKMVWLPWGSESGLLTEVIKGRLDGHLGG